MAGSSQKFIARNRAPRVQIEYDVELYGAEKKVQLPFVMGVMSDLSGKSEAPQPSIADRKFLEIDVDNFDDRMKSMKPRAAFTVPNTLTGEGNLAVDVTFESMDDFSPAAIARKVEPLRKLLEARTQLSNLMTYMDGKTGAEALLDQVLADRSLLAALAGHTQGADASLPLDTLRRSLADLPVAEPDVAAPAIKATFDALKSGVSSDVGGYSDTADVLQALKATPVPQEPDGADASSILSSLRDTSPMAEAADPVEDILAGLISAGPAVEEAQDDAPAALATLRLNQSETAPSLGDSVTEALTSLRAAAPEEPAAAADPLDDLLASFETAPELPAASEEPAAAADPLDDLLASFDTTPELPAAPEEPAAAIDPLDDLLASFETAPEPPAAPEEPSAAADLLDDLLASFDTASEPPSAPEEPVAVIDPLDDLLASFDTASEPPSAPEEPVAAIDPLDDLLASFETAPESPAAPEEPAAAIDPLDDLLASFDTTPELPAPSYEPADPLDDLLASFETAPEPPVAPEEPAAAGDPLDDLLADLGAAATSAPDPLADLMSEMNAVQPVVSQDPFGRLSAPLPTADQLRRSVFRIAVLGDFTGRAARGLVETGPALVKRRGVKLDVDTLDRTIEGMATTLVLPVGADGAGIEVRLASLDDLHPDELYENVDLFAELASLRQRLSGSQAEAAVRDMAGWGDRFGTRVQPGYRQSSGSAVPADRKLGDFQRLIGDHEGLLQQASPAADLIARIVGPHVVAAPSSDVAACKAMVDAALSDAMRLVLHHPEFQQIEAQWRTLELLARRIEADTTLQVVLYDISAEELATDLAAQEDLAHSGLFGLLADEPLSESGAGGFSAVVGLYTFEETPPHAELLARIARIAAHIEAPFITAISPSFLDTPKADRHPLVAAAWNRLRAMPEARYLGIASPRVLLRHPYGRRSEPIERFAFEEFTLTEGLSGMLWGNPATLVAVLLAAGWSKDGAKMQLGQIMTLGDIPFHTFTDAHGDQVALPCTERNLTLTKMEVVVTRGFMPLVSIRGRDQVRLASFQSLGGSELRGPWSASEPRAAPSVAPVAQLVVEFPVAEAVSAEPAAADDLDALPAAFGNEAAPRDPEAIDADLAALLEGL